MAGIVVMSVVSLWIVMAYFLSKRATHRLVKGKGRQVSVFIGLFLALLIMPILDDIIIGIEFRQLCKHYSEINMDKDSVNGKSVYLDISNGIEKNGLLMRAIIKEFEYIDIESGEVIVSYSGLTTKSSFLTKLYPGGIAPLTYKRMCTPKGAERDAILLKKHGITYVEKKT